MSAIRVFLMVVVVLMVGSVVFGQDATAIGSDSWVRVLVVGTDGYVVSAWQLAADSTEQGVYVEAGQSIEFYSTQCFSVATNDARFTTVVDQSGQEWNFSSVVLPAHSERPYYTLELGEIVETKEAGTNWGVARYLFNFSALAC